MTRKLYPPPLDRRRFLGLAGAAVLAPGSLLAAASKKKPAAAAAVSDGIPPARRRMIQMNGYPLDAETPLDALTTYLTPNDLFFVRHHWIPQYPSRKGWFLTLDGEVERPMRITLDDLRRMPRTTLPPLTTPTRKRPPLRPGRSRPRRKRPTCVCAHSTSSSSSSSLPARKAWRSIATRASAR